MSSWYSELESKIFTYLKHEMDYPGLFCTSGSMDYDPSKFPTLRFSEISLVEKDRDVIGKDVNCVEITFAISVYSDSSETECKEISDLASQVMKTMSFDIVGSDAVMAYSGGAVRKTIRYRRRIGSEDKIY